MSFFATFVLVFVLIVRPQEIWPVLNVLHLLDVFTGLAALGVIIDLATGKLKGAYSPQLPFVGAFVVICYVSTTILIGRASIPIAFSRSAIPAIFMICVMYGANNFARLRALIVLLVVLSAFVSVVAVHQGHVDPVCIELPPPESGGQSAEDGTADGRACDTAFSCEKGGKSGIDYACERLGMFNTVSTGRRVKWRGQLGDPNELSVFIGAVLPLLFAITSYTKKKAAWVPALLVVGIGLWAVILTQSRGGQLVVGVVFMIYFVSRFGAKGMIGAALLALPVLMLGGREGLEADESAEERLSLLYDGATMIWTHPIFGVGTDQFSEHVRIGLTAHNAYVLAAAELGFPGLYIWSSLLWSSLKIPLTIVRRPPAAMDAQLRPFAMALLVSFIGMSIGIFFLSFTYKQLLFTWFGLAGALYGLVRRQAPTFEVKFGKWDFIGVGAFDVALITMIYTYTRLKVQ